MITPHPRRRLNRSPNEMGVPWRALLLIAGIVATALWAWFG